MRVRVWSGDTHESLGEGTLTHYEDVKMEGIARVLKTPVIQLDSGGKKQNQN